MAHASKKHIILIDCGDTLIDEGTEEKDERGVTLRAELIPGADDLIRTLDRRSYRIALVADGFAGTFHNVLTQHGIIDCFETMAISEVLGVEKPNPEIFHAALAAMGIGNTVPPEHIVMVGNNLERDIRGANLLGFTSVWIDWAPRRSKHPADESEVPDYVIKLPMELLAILDELERIVG